MYRASGYIFLFQFYKTKVNDLLVNWNIDGNKISKAKWGLLVFFTFVFRRQKSEKI